MEKLWIREKEQGWLISVIWLMLVFLIGLFFEIPIWNLVKFIYYQITLFFLCGSFALKLTGIRFENYICFLFTAYAIGYAVNILIYAFFLILGAQNYVNGYCVIASLFFVAQKFFMRKKMKTIGKADNRDLIVLLTFMLIALTIGFLSFQCNNLSVEMQKYFSGINQDNVFWFNKAVEVTKGYPVPNLSVSGLDVYYHYFSSFAMAFLHFATGINLFDLCYAMSYCMNIFLLLGAIYVLLKENLKSQMLIYIGMAAILFCTGVEKMTNVYYVHHIYVGSFGFAEGFALSMFTVCYFLKLIDEKRDNIIKWVVAIILFAAALGLKYPCACIVLVAIGVNCIFMLFDRNTILRAFAVGTSYLIIFAGISVFFVIGLEQPLMEEGVIRQGFSWINTLFERNYYYVKYAPILGEMFNSSIIASTVTVVMYIITTNFVMNYFLIMAFVIKAKNRGVQRTWDEKKKYISLLISIIVGYILFFFFWQDGFSQVYFMFSIYPLGMLLAFNILECYIKEKKIIMHVGILLMIISLGFSFRTLAPYMLRGFTQLLQQNEELDLDAQNAVTQKEYEGLLWIKDNLDDDVILITNKMLGEERQTSFVTSAYSERQVYIQGQRYNGFNSEIKKNRLDWVEKYFNGNSEIKEILIDNGVSYAVLYKNITDYDDFPQSDSIVFENEEISVIKLEKRND